MTEKGQPAFQIATAKAPTEVVRPGTGNGPADGPEPLSAPEVHGAPDIQSMGLKATLVTGFSVIFLFFVVFLGWAALAPLGSAAIAPGMVLVESNRKTIQHLEGGIVGEIKVQDGGQVKAGQVLIVLDKTQALASLELVRGRKVAAIAREARLIAERDDKDEIVFPAWLMDAASDSKVFETINGQNNIFEARRKAKAGQVAILKQRIAQYGEEIVGFKGQIKAEDYQLEIIADEIRDVGGLVEKGLARMPRLRALQRNSAEIEGSRSQNVARIAQTRQAIAEARLQINELTTSMLNEVAQELRDVQSQLFDLVEQERAAADILERTEIRAPMAGTIVNLQVHTQGGVIAPGGPLMDFVPAGERLVVEARADPGDIDSVHVGLPAQVRFPAFNQRNTAPVEGTVTRVSADSLTDERTGMTYFLARIRLDDDPKAKLEVSELHSGMQAEVMITTGERTALDYFLKPITRSFSRALREE